MAGYQQLLLFPQCFQNLSLLDSVKPVFTTVLRIGTVYQIKILVSNQKIVQDHSNFKSYSFQRQIYVY